MNYALLSQLTDLSEVQKAVRKHFNEEETPLSVLLILLAMVGIVLLTYLLSKYAGNLHLPEKRNRVQPFYQQMLKKLGVTTPQRRWLERLAVDLQLKQPTMILLSPTLFDRHVCEWKRKGFRHKNKLTPSDQAAFIHRIRNYLFPVVRV